MQDGTLIFDTKIDKTGAINGMDSLQASMSSKLTALGGKFQTTGAIMTAALTVPIVMAGKNMVQAASDYEENLNKIDVAFKDNAQEVKDWAANAGKMFGLSKNQALDAASTFGDMGTSMGLTTGEAADMSTSLAGLAGDMASFKNKDVSEVMTALNGVFTGETEALKGLGIVMNETSLEDFAARTGKVYKEMSQAEKVALRYEYVMDKTKNAQGDYARTSDGTANTLRGFQVAVSDLSIAFGQHLLPILTPFVQKINALIMSFAEASPTTQKVVLAFLGLLAAAGPLAFAIGSVMKIVNGGMGVWAKLTRKVITDTAATSVNTAAKTANATATTVAATAQSKMSRLLAVGKWALLGGAILGASLLLLKFAGDGNAASEMIKNFAGKIQELVSKIAEKLPEILNSIITMLPQLIETGVSILSSIIDGIVKAIPKLAATLPTIITSILNVITENLPTIIEAGLSILKALLDGLVKAAPDIAKEIPGIIKAVIKAITDNLPAIIEAGVDILNALIEGIISFIPMLVEMLPEIIMTIITAITENLPTIIEAGIEILTALIEGLVTAIPKIAAALPTIILAVVNAIIANLPAILKAGVEILLALIGGLVQAIPQLISAIPVIIASIVSAIASLLYQLIKAGVDLIKALWEGFWSWVKTFFSKVLDFAKTIPKKIKDGLGSLFNIGKDLIKGLWNGISSVGDWIWDKIKGFCGGIVDKVKGFFGIKSPSRLFRDSIGKMLSLGLADGIASQTKAVVKAGVGQAKALVSAYSKEMEEMDAFNSTFTLTPKSPVLTGVAGGSAADGNSAGSTLVEQTININQPVRTPAETARAIRNQVTFGLAGA